MSELLNYTDHSVNIVANGELQTPRYDIDPSLVLSARAAEIRRPMGQVAIAGTLIEINELTFGRPVRLPPRRPGTLAVVSLDTLRAIHRETGDMSGYAVPDDIIRGADGMPLGARGLAVPELIDPPNPDFVTPLSEETLEVLQHPQHWENFAPFPINIYPPDAPDVLDPSQVPSLLTIPRSEPVTVERGRELDLELTEQWNVPIYRTKLGEIVNPRQPEAGKAAFAPQELLRLYPQFGHEICRLAFLGRPVRDHEGQVIGGREIVVFSRREIITAPF